MCFTIETFDIPSFWIGDDDPGAFTGVFPPGRQLQVMREEFPRYDGLSDKEAWYYYISRVPLHSPVLVKYAVIREVVWTPFCLSKMSAFYSKSCNIGKLVDWLGAECIAICPGTSQ